MAAGRAVTAGRAYQRNLYQRQSRRDEPLIRALTRDLGGAVSGVERSLDQISAQAPWLGPGSPGGVQV